MIIFNTIGEFEKYDSLSSVKAAADYVNGTLGTVENGVFTAKAAGTHFVYEVEKGDDMYLDSYTVKKDAQIRVCELAKLNGKEVRITSVNLPKTVAEKDKLTSNASGTLVVSSSATAPYLVVKELRPYGVLAEIVGE